MDKLFIKISIVLIILLIIVSVIYIININNIGNHKDPILYITKKIANDGGSIIYNCMFYKIIKYRNVNNDDCIYSIGSPFMKFNNPFL